MGSSFADLFELLRDRARASIVSHNSFTNDTANTDGTPGDSHYFGLLWSEKYSPKHYFDLLSEEV